MDLFEIILEILGLKRRKVVSAASVKKIKDEWNQINILIKGRSPSQLKQALISADKCLDFALKDLVEGNTMGERLKSGCNLFDKTTLDKVWEAHKIRNNLVHEPSYEPPYFVLLDGVEKLRKGLDALGVRV